MNAPTLEQLDLASLPSGQLHHRWLHIAEDGMGQPIRLPLLIARGSRPGPVAGITAAVHGNEVNGVPVIHRLLARLDVTRLRGTVVAVPVVNVMGFLLHQRRTDDGMDLNHLFPGKPQGREAVVYAWRFHERLLRHFDLLLDLHTASFGRVNCLYVRADMTDPDVARMAYLQRPQVIVHNPPADGTLRGAAAAIGIPAVTVEVGNPQRIHREYVRSTVTGLRAVLAARKMVPKRPLKMGKAPVVCEESAWMFTDRGGWLEFQHGVTDRVEVGQELATLRDIFGSPISTYRAPHDGIVIGHSVDPVAATGARIVHLGRPAPAHSPLLARLEEAS